MLGRLKMSIRECIAAYKIIAPKVFSERLRHRKPFKLLSGAAGVTWFKGEDLEKAVQDLLVELSANGKLTVDEGADARGVLLKEADDPACRV